MVDEKLGFLNPSSIVLGLTQAWYGDYSGNVVPFSSGGGVGSIYYTKFQNEYITESIENRSFIIILSSYDWVFINLENNTFTRCINTNSSPSGIGDNRTFRFPTDLVSFQINLVYDRTYNIAGAGNYGTFLVTSNTLTLYAYTSTNICFMI